MMVALTGLLAEHYRAGLGEYQIAELAYVIEREDLGITGGMQDQYAATFGGFNFIEFTDRVIVNPLRIRDEIAHELELSLLLCFTGITRDSARVIEDQTRRASGAGRGHLGRAAGPEGTGCGHEGRASHW